MSSKKLSRKLQKLSESLLRTSTKKDLDLDRAGVGSSTLF